MSITNLHHGLLDSPLCFINPSGTETVMVTLHYSEITQNPVRADIAIKSYPTTGSGKTLAQGLLVESEVRHGFLRIRDDGSLCGLPYALGQIVLMQTSSGRELHPIGCGPHLSGIYYEKT